MRKDNKMPTEYDPLPEDPEPTLASAIRWGRHFSDQTLRGLAKVSGVSVAQISRLEAGQVKRPAIETLVALAAGMNAHPTPLLILAGHLRGHHAADELGRLFEQMADTLDEEYGKGELERLKKKLDDPTEERLRGVALTAFTMDAPEIGWPETLAAMIPATAPDPDLLRQLVEIWRELSPDRRWRLLETAKDIREGSRAERRKGQYVGP